MPDLETLQRLAERLEDDTDKGAQTEARIVLADLVSIGTRLELLWVIRGIVETYPHPPELRFKPYVEKKIIRRRHSPPSVSRIRARRGLLCLVTPFWQR